MDTRIMRVALVIGLMAIALLGLGLPSALAQDGPTPPEITDPVGTNVAPHSGYSSLTDYCLQCHQVHTNTRGADYVGEYALLADLSVTATCATCHGYLGKTPTGAEDPGFAGVEGTTSSRAVYIYEPIHTIGATSSRTEGNWTYGWGYGGGPSGPSTRRAGAGTASTYGGGFYCGTCHTPHGEFGQLINSKWAYTTARTGDPEVVRWQNDTMIYWDNPNDAAHSYTKMFLWQPSAGAPWQVCTAAGGTEPCYYAQIRDAEGQLVSLYGYKLLSYVPNHQYPLKQGGLYVNGSDGGTIPPGGVYADAPMTVGTLVNSAANPTGTTTGGNCPGASEPGPCPVLNTESVLGTLTADITAGGTSVGVTSPSGTLAALPVPFKVRIDDEIMMVTDKAGGGATLTVVRSGENAEQPWLTDAAVGHNAGAEILRVPTLLVTETAASPPKPPYHITFSAGTPTNDEVAVVMGRTAVSGSNFLYTVARAVDGTPQNETHAAGVTIRSLTGTSVATVKSWGVDIYSHDSALWCGTCHTGSIAAQFGGGYHSHPTDCTACHGNPSGVSADFPHSSDGDPLMLKEVPDALCISCHTKGSLP